MACCNRFCFMNLPFLCVCVFYLFCLLYVVPVCKVFEAIVCVSFPPFLFVHKCILLRLVFGI